MRRWLFAEAEICSQRFCSITWRFFRFLFDWNIFSRLKFWLRMSFSLRMSFQRYIDSPFSQLKKRNLEFSCKPKTIRSMRTKRSWAIFMVAFGRWSTRIIKSVTRNFKLKQRISLLNHGILFIQLNYVDISLLLYLIFDYCQNRRWKTKFAVIFLLRSVKFHIEYFTSLRWNM